MKSAAFLLVWLGLCSSGAPLAQQTADPALPSRSSQDARMVRLETALNRLQLEQQAVYQQFQMTQELRRGLLQEGGPGLAQPGPTVTGGLKDHPPPSYDEQVRLQRERQARIDQYARDLDRLHARYAELAERRQALLDQLIELAGQPDS